jgi:serine/threonine-protein kinase HipA
MSAHGRELVASIEGRDVGVLRERGNLWSFEYVDAWIHAADGYDLAPSLPRAPREIVDGGSARPVQWFFDNLLPEEGAREALSRDAGIPGADAFGLLAHYGRESAGALTLLPRGESQPAPDYLPIDDGELHRRIRDRPRRMLAASAPKKMSNAGAQDKLAVAIRGGRLFHPVGSAASTHLLKPDLVDRENWPDTVANEYYVMRLAASLGLVVPAVDIRFVPDPVYLIERFDRTSTHAGARRTHAIDACQLLGVDRLFKYEIATVATLVRCIEACADRARSRRQLLDWALFNVLVGNADAHLKNISFHVDATGIRIAPFYDLLSTECHHATPGNTPRWPQCPLTMPIGSARTFADVGRAEFLEFADALGVTAAAAKRAIDAMTGRIEPEADRLYEEFLAREIPDAAGRAGQLKTLRSIRRIVIQEMSAKFRVRPG